MEPLQVIAIKAGLAGSHELRSALPDAPVRAEPERPYSASRIRLASELRRLADRLAPPEPAAEVASLGTHGRRDGSTAWTATNRTDAIGQA